jgi:hypothetical protein
MDTELARDATVLDVVAAISLLLLLCLLLAGCSYVSDLPTTSPDAIPTAEQPQIVMHCEMIKVPFLTGNLVDDTLSVLNTFYLALVRAWTVVTLYY